MDRASNPSNYRKTIKGSEDLFVHTAESSKMKDIPIPMVKPESIKIYQDYLNTINRIRDGKYEDKNNVIKSYVNFIQ